MHSSAPSAGVIIIMFKNGGYPSHSINAIDPHPIGAWLTF
jgi:hypothetical protein